MLKMFYESNGVQNIGDSLQPATSEHKKWHTRLFKPVGGKGLSTDQLS